MPSAFLSRRLALAAVVLTLLARTAPAVGQTVPTPPAPAAMPGAEYQRLNFIDMEFLGIELGAVPELDFLDAKPETRARLAADFRAKLAAMQEKAAKEPAAKVEATGLQNMSIPILDLQSLRWEALGLTVRKGNDCRRPEKEATLMATHALQLRSGGVVSSPVRRGQAVPAPVLNMYQILKNAKPELFTEMIPALVQTMQAEEEPSRGLLVALLSRSDNDAATEALARRALYDLSPLVRAQAVQELKNRPAAKVRQILLEGLRYPWPVVADHAAETLVALADRDAVPALQKLVAEPDPGLPIVRPGTGRVPVIREVVRLNHLRNCMLCHAPAQADRSALVAPVPTPGVELPVAYYGSRAGGGDLFVRADITYLRQDFSVTQFVPNAAPWPDKQRFDFVVRERDATADELEWLKKPPATYPQREAVLWALKELTR